MVFYCTFMRNQFLFLLTCILLAHPLPAEIPRELRVGRASHAFDHLGNTGEQAETAAASGVNIIYATGLGAIGYEGLPTPEKLGQSRVASAAYVRRAKANDIRLVLGYLCSTSIVRLNTFDQNWSSEFRAQFKTPPAQWRQQDKDGKPLPSWYGGDYQPACMNNPDWRTYEKFMVRQQLETGHDGIFFDNPTVHVQGCYCPHCMEKFGSFLAAEKISTEFSPKSATDSLIALRQYAASHPAEFMRFRATIARSFLDEMRNYARSIKRNALITCNNSLNSPDVLFSQSRTYAYNIYEMSKVEDLVVVEDMSTQPRALPNGQTLEYGPTYKLLHAISHQKPIVAVTIAEGDYHTPPNLVRLAMAEAAAHEASYLAWPTWPENQRQRMAEAIRPQADFLRCHEDLLNEMSPRADVVLFFPHRRWLETDRCTASSIATELSRANMQFKVVCEEDFIRLLEQKTKSKHKRDWELPILLIESASVLKDNERAVLQDFQKAGGKYITVDGGNWMATLRQEISRPSLVLQAPPSVRAVVRDQRNRTLIHLLNLNIQRLNSFQDKVQAATDLKIVCRVPFNHVRSVKALTADTNGTSGTLDFSTTMEKGKAVATIKVPRLEINSILVIER